MISQKVLGKIIAERARQDAKWGQQNHHPLFWNSIIGEEYGEAQKELNALVWRRDPGLPLDELDAFEKEITEMVACGIALLECLERDEWLEILLISRGWKRSDE